MPVISDDGTVLAEDIPAHLFPLAFIYKRITPADIVGRYEADSYISSLDLLRLKSERLAMGEDVAKEDRVRFPIPLDNLIAGCCIDIALNPGNASKEEIEAAWVGVYEGIIAAAAAELAVRRDLRDKRIGVKDD